MIAIPLSFILFGSCLYCKNKSGNFRLHNFVTPFLVSIGWIFLFLPFGVIIPSISTFIANTTGIFIFNNIFNF